MAKSQQTFSKKEREKKKRKKKKDKIERREQRKIEKAEKGKLSFEDQLSYLDENGNITSTPPDPSKKKKIKAEDIVLGIPPREKIVEDKIRTGTVDTFLFDKGYGFITDSVSKASVFCHINDVYEGVQVGDQVRFEVEKGLKGAKASNVQFFDPKEES